MAYADKIAALWLWFGVISILALFFGPWLWTAAAYRVRRSRRRRQILQALQRNESGA